MKNMKRSLKIAIDGFDGAGKSTLIKILREECYNEFLTSVEHLLPITVEIFKRYSNNTNDYLNILSNEFRVVSYLWESLIRLKICEEMYDAKDIVFFDRWIYTNLTGKLNFESYQNFIEYLIYSLPSPDLLILLKTSPQNIIDRLKKKDDWMLHFYTEDQIKKDSLNFYQGYEKILQKTNVNYLIVDGNQSLNDLKYILKNYINQLILTLRG